MEETYLDDGLAGNFERATLEIANIDSEFYFMNFRKKIFNVQEDIYKHKLLNALSITLISVKSTTESSDDTSKRNSTSKNMCNMPFKHIDVHTFFTDRNEVVERAINDCMENLIKENNDELIGSWLLTEYMPSV